MVETCLGGGFKYVLFSPILGNDSHFDKYFSIGLKPPIRFYLFSHPVSPGGNDDPI